LAWWDDRAQRIQQGVRHDESKQPFGLYDDDDVRKAVVHTREDTVLVAIHLSSVNRQLAIVRTLLVILVVAAIVTIVHHW
jgi:hypothetical protein